LIRAVAGGAAVAQGGVAFVHGSDASLWLWGLSGAAILAGSALVVGFLTPAAAAAVALTTVLLGPAGGTSTLAALMMVGRSGALVIADAVALAMLGPGAWSIDAYLFGRREIIVSATRHAR
jgi:uncharacterized membrane protein YphA (DoxX/SURF4 family)